MVQLHQINELWWMCTICLHMFVRLLTLNVQTAKIRAVSRKEWCESYVCCHLWPWKCSLQSISVHYLPHMPLIIYMMIFVMRERPTIKVVNAFKRSDSSVFLTENNLNFIIQLWIGDDQSKFISEDCNIEHSSHLEVDEMNQQCGRWELILPCKECLWAWNSHHLQPAQYSQILKQLNPHWLYQSHRGFQIAKFLRPWISKYL